MNGTNPDGSPTHRGGPGQPRMPARLGAADGPFDTTDDPHGCSAPLTAECADHYNKLYGFAAAKRAEQPPRRPLQPDLHRRAPARQS